MKTKRLTKLTKIIISAVSAFALAFGFIAPTIKTANAYKYNVSLTNPGFESDFSTGWKISGDQNNAVTSEIIETTTHGGGTGKVYKISSASNVSYGIETTYTTDLSANSHYCLSVWAKANSTTTKFSFGVFGTEFSKESTQTADTTEWNKYKIYIQTNSSRTAAIAINLWLGSKTDEAKASSGEVLFDDVSLTKIDRMQYLKYSNAENSISELDLYEEANTNIQLISGTSTNWDTTFGDKITASNEEFTFNSTEQDGDTYSKYVIRANNSEGTSSISLNSHNISLEKFGLYRISIFAKAISDKASFSIKIESGEDSVEKIVTDLSKNATDNSLNGFTEYEFYVRTNHSSNATIVMTVSIEGGSSILLDNAKVENSTLTKFNSGSNKLDLLTETTETIANGHFTQITKNSAEPKEANSWKKIVESTATMGVVTSTTEYYVVNNIHISIPTYYKISSEEATFAGIQSNTFSTSYSESKPISKITVIVKTTNGTKATVSLFESSNLVATQKNISTNGEWKAVTFFIKSSKSMSLSLQLSLGESSTIKSQGEADFYAATCVATTEEVYTTHKSDNNAYETFWDNTSYFSHNGVKENGVYQLLAANFNIESDQNESFGGVLDLELIDTDSVFAGHSIKNPDGEQKGEYLALYTNNGTISSTHLSGDTTTLTGFVKLTTKAMVLGTANATIDLGEFGTFTVQADENWHTISVFVNSGTEKLNTINPKITLSSEEESIILCDKVEFQTISKNEYKNATENEYQKKFDLTSSESDAEEEQKSESKTTKNSTNWTAVFFIALSSALLVGAVLAALIAKAVKRLPKRTVVTLPTSGYGKKKANKSSKTTKNDKDNKKGFV